MRAGNNAFTFLQVSDVHLDSNLAFTRLRLPPSKRATLNREILQALLDGFTLVREKQLDAVVIPGDLWDSESVTSRTVNEVIEAAAALYPVPVIIAPGNHDYCSSDSFYSEKVLRMRGMRAWPANVHIFSTGEFQTFTHPYVTDVSFTGRAFSGNVPVDERLLSGRLPMVEGATNVLLFHGSLDGYRGGDSYLPGKRTAPFSADELEALDFNYAAIGHYHEKTEIRSSQGKLLGAYTGCLMGRGIDETGAKGALIVSLHKNSQPLLEPVELASRRVIVAGCNITGQTRQQILLDVEDRLRRSGARPGVDIVYLTVEGRHPVGAEPSFLQEELSAGYYHAVVDDRSRPDYAFDEIDARTTEGKFVASMMEMKKQAESSGGAITSTKYGELSIAAIENALYYGMDALKQKKVAIRYVD